MPRYLNFAYLFVNLTFFRLCDYLMSFVNKLLPGHNLNCSRLREDFHGMFSSLTESSLLHIQQLFQVTGDPRLVIVKASNCPGEHDILHTDVWSQLNTGVDVMSKCLTE